MSQMRFCDFEYVVETSVQVRENPLPSTGAGSIFKKLEDDRYREGQMMSF